MNEFLNVPLLCGATLKRLILSFTVLGILVGCGNKSTTHQDASTDDVSLYIDEQGWAALRQQRKTNPLLNKLVLHAITEADSMKKSPAFSVEMDNRGNMLNISRDALAHITNLTTAYKFTGDKTYADKAINIMKEVAAFESWNPAHFLDVAEMTMGVGLGYNWLRKELTDEDKKIIAKAIFDKGVKHAYDAYRGTSSEEPWYLGVSSEKKNYLNWHVVSTSGMLIGALAIKNEYPEESQLVIDEGIVRLKDYATLFAPDGLWYEGLSYWGYAVDYFMIAVEAITTALGDDQGLKAMPGLSQTGYAYLMHSGPTGRVFNFADDLNHRTTMRYNPFLLWISKEFQQADLAETVNEHLSTRPLPRIHYEDRLYPFIILNFYSPSAVPHRLPKAKIFGGLTETYVYRSSWEDSTALFLAAKGGNNSLSHQHLDIGTFVLDDAGERWVHDLGANHYNLPNMWGREQESKRWTYYRNNNKSHNTITIGNNLQRVAGESYFSKSFGKNTAVAVLNMTSAYLGQASSVIRGFNVQKEKLLLIQDEISNPTGAVQWKIITRASARVEGSTVILEQHGKQFFLQALGLPHAVWEVVPALPSGKEEMQNEGFFEVRLILPPKNELQTIRVLLSSDKNIIAQQALQQLVPLQDWEEIY